MIFTHEFKEKLSDAFIIVSTIAAVVGTIYLTRSSQSQPTGYPQRVDCPYRHQNHRGW